MCENPITAYTLRSIPLSAKVYYDCDWLTNPFTKIRFKKPSPREAGNYYKIKIPCGWCLECRLKKSRDWSTRCYLESKLHKESCFVTLTYNNKNLPYKDGEMSLRIEDIQLFFKRLLKKYPDKKILRFWAGEYGEKRGRPHFHAIILGYKPQDLVAERKKSNRGYTTYRSKELQKIWGLGYVNIGTVTAESSGYVARYTLKKAGIKPQKQDRSKWLTNPKWQEWKRNHRPQEWRKNPYRVWIKPKEIGKERERCNSSKRPAIGLNWWLLHKDEIKQQESIYVYCNEKLQVRGIPNYFIKKWKEENWEEATNFQYKQQVKFEKEHLELLKRTHQTEEEWRARQTESLHQRTRRLIRPTEFEDILPTAPTATLGGSGVVDKILLC